MITFTPCIILPCPKNPKPFPPPTTYNYKRSLPSRQIQTKPPSPPDPTNYASLIESCTTALLAHQLHAHALKTAFSACREFLETRLLLAYGRCGSVQAARLLFDKMPQRSIYSWAALLTVCVDHGYPDQSLTLFNELLEEGIELKFFVFPVLLKACSGLGAFDAGRGLHGFVVKTGFASNIYVGNALLDMYGKCGSIDDAVKALMGMPQRDTVSWNSVIGGCAAGGMVFEALEFLERMWELDNIRPDVVSWSAVIGVFAQNSHDEEAVEVLRRMIESGTRPNAQTLASVLPACGRQRALDAGKEIHGYVARQGIVSNSFVVNGLIDVYRRCGEMGIARELFSRFSVRNIVSYNTMIVGYCENNELDMAKEMFDYMETDGVRRDVISWNSMISGYGDNGRWVEALMMFGEMRIEGGLEADSFTLGSALTACATLAELRHGKELHSHAISKGLDSNTFVGGALVEMYFRCQDPVAAELVFRNIAEKNTVTWNVFIAGYARNNQMTRYHELLSHMRKDGFDPNIYSWNGLIAGCMENGYNELAMQMFFDLQTTGLMPDIYTVGMMIPVCSRLVSIRRGKEVHAYSIRFGYDMEVHIGAVLVDMYAKCGSITLASLAFNRIMRHNLVSYNSILAGYAMHGLRNEGLKLFHKMVEDELRPDEITFVSVLSLCVHGGSVEEGLQYFNLMARYEIMPDLKHYTCLVDLFSRAGKLTEAHKLIRNMPMKPDAVVWSALLAGCVIHCNVKLGEIAANNLIELDDGNAGNYVLLSNLYAIAGREEGFNRTRQTIKEKGIHKSPGCSWIEDKDQLHVFLANDRSHEATNEIFNTIDSLSLHMRKLDGMVALVY